MLPVLILVTLAFGVTHSQDCDTFQTDQCGSGIWPFLVDTNQAPADQAQLESTCTTLREGDKCLRDFFKKCPQLVKKSYSDFLESITTTITDFCTGNLGKRFLPHGACIKENLAKNFTCNTDAIKFMEIIAVHEPASERLRLTCCTYISLDKCFTDTVTSACDRKAARAIRNLMQSYAIFLVDKCLPFLSNPAECDLSVLRSAPPAGARKPKSFLPALIDVAGVAL